MNNLNIDFIFIDDTLFINSINVDKEKRRNKIGSNAIKELELQAKTKTCNTVIVPSDLSKIALNFWLKNGFNCTESTDLEKVYFVLNSDTNAEYIFDIEDNSVVQLSKEI